MRVTESSVKESGKTGTSEEFVSLFEVLPVLILYRTYSNIRMESLRGVSICRIVKVVERKWKRAMRSALTAEPQ